MTHKIDRNSVVLEKLKSNPCFIKRYKLEKAKDSNFRNYVTSLTQDDSIYIVDIGWKGTIQDNIQKALPDKKVVGYYLALSTMVINRYLKIINLGSCLMTSPHKTPFLILLAEIMKFMRIFLLLIMVQLLPMIMLMVRYYRF